jgi:peptidoglycan/LPS O-acetylase OafA/YrhL
VTRILMSPPLRWLGRISYSLYLSHLAIVWASGIVVAKLSGAPLSAPLSARDAVLSTPVALLCYALTLALVLLVAQLSYSWIEAPCRNWSRQKISSAERGDIASEPVTV